MVKFYPIEPPDDDENDFGDRMMGLAIWIGIATAGALAIAFYLMGR